MGITVGFLVLERIPVSLCESKEVIQELSAGTIRRYGSY